MLIETGEAYEVEKDDDFRIELFPDSEGYAAVREIEWVKKPGGIPMKQTYIIAGDQVLGTGYLVRRRSNLEFGCWRSAFCRSTVSTDLHRPSPGFGRASAVPVILLGKK